MTTSRVHAPEILNKNPGSHGNPEPSEGATSATGIRADIVAALDRAGWQIDDLRDDRVEASDGERYGLAVLFKRGVPVEICYGDGELDMQHSEVWNEAPGILNSEEVAQLFSDEERSGE